MWLANYEDGTSTNGVKQHWTDLQKEKRITGLQLIHPRIAGLNIAIRGLDSYYFYNEAVAAILQQGVVVAEVIGGHDIAHNSGVEIRMSAEGAVQVKMYDLKMFKHSKEILLPGKGIGAQPVAA